MGEVGGGGNTKVKMLTDFEIDPTSTRRDYLIYSPSGNSVRYYPLLSNQPLFAVDLNVFYIDMNGNIHELLINGQQQASIKLEFKPID